MQNVPKNNDLVDVATEAAARLVVASRLVHLLSNAPDQRDTGGYEYNTPRDWTTSRTR